MSDSIFNALKRHESFSNKVQVEASPTTPRGGNSNSLLYSPRSNDGSVGGGGADSAGGTTPRSTAVSPTMNNSAGSSSSSLVGGSVNGSLAAINNNNDDINNGMEKVSSTENNETKEEIQTEKSSSESSNTISNNNTVNTTEKKPEEAEVSSETKPSNSSEESDNTTTTTEKKDIATVNSTTIENSTQRTLKDFKIVKKIGGGNEGAVFSAELKNPLEGEDANVAIKLVVCEDPEEIETARRDLQFLLTLQQENIVKHHYIFEEKKKGSIVEQTRFYIVMEYCIDGSLELEISRRQREQRPFETDIIKSWTKQICKCMEYMHSQKIAHRDIKPDNILLTKNKQMIKVCDFGFTRKDEKLMNTVMGTMKYIAPEMLESKRYDEAVDIWSLGILLFQLLCLYSQSEIPDLINEIRNNPEYIMQRLKNNDEVLVRIIDRCLKIDPVDRPEAKEIISDLDKEISELIPKIDQNTPSTPSKSDEFIDNDVKELASLLGQLERARLMKIRDPLKSIELDKAREFWKQSGWAEMKEVTWANFRQAYQEYLDFDKIPKNAERGFKKMITANQGFDVDIVDDERTGIVTVLSYNNLVRKAGFPFNLDVLNLIQNCLVIGESNWDIEEYLKPLSEQAYETAESQYLDMILQNERLFVEPISQETLYVDEHCVPLHLIQHGKNWVDELIGTGSSTNSASTTTTTQASDDKEFDNERRVHIIEDFSEELSNGKTDEKVEYEEYKNIFHEDGAEFISSLPSNNLRFLLTSNASSGKTSMLKMVVTRFIKKKIEQRKSSQVTGDRILIPLFIPAGIFASLRNADADFRLKCIRASAGASMQNSANGNSVRYVNLLEHYLMTAMKEQRVLFIFDGIDEIASPQQKKRLLLSLVEQFPPPDEVSNSNGLMVTTRLGGIEADSKTRKFFSSFIAATLENLTFDIQKKIALKRNIVDSLFFSAIKGKYRELAKNPLLLSLIIQEYKTNGSLPEIRSKIYQNALQTITRLHYTKLVSDQQKVNRMQITLIEFLRKVSIFLHKLRRHTFSSQDFTNSIEVARKLSLNNTSDGGLFTSTAENDLVSKGDDWIFHAVSNGEFQNQWKVLQPRIDSGKFPLIMACGDGKYRFSHTSFQQYLVASHWANTSVVSDFRVRATGPFSKNKLEFFKERIQQFIVDPFYTETFLFCASEMAKNDFDDFIKLIMKLFKKDLTSVDSVIYNMIMERPKSEHQEYSKIMKQLKTDENVSMIVQGLIHKSEDLRNKAITRSFMYNQLFEKIGDGLLQHVETNEYAIHALSIIMPKGEQKFVSILIKKLEETKDINIRKRLCICIGKLADRGDKAVISALTNIINNTPKGTSNKANVPLIEAAIEAITKVAEKEDSTIINMLIPMLNDYNFRKVACIGLGSVAKYGDPLVISELTKVSNKCYEACICLGKLAEKGDMEIIDTLIDCLKESSFDDMIVSEAFSAVVIPDLLPVIQYRLLNMLENERKSIAYRVAMALGSISQRKDPALVSKLLQMLKTSSQPDRIICALGYSAPKEDEVVICALLEQFSNRSSKDVNREQSAIALAQIAKKGDQKIIEILCKRLLSESEEVITSCTTTLEKISHTNNQAVIDTFIQLLKHTDIGVVEVSVRLLGRKSERGAQNIVQHLMERLENREVPEVIRALCAESLGYVANYNDEKVVQSLLLRIIEEGRSMVILRLHAIKAIGMLKSERVNDNVVSTLFDYILTISSNDDVDTRKFIMHAVFILSLFCDINSMIDRLRNKTYKAHKHIIFDILVKAIRFIRLRDKSFRLDTASIELLQKQDDLEALFILIENSLIEDADL